MRTIRKHRRWLPAVLGVAATIVLAGFVGTASAASSATTGDLPVGVLAPFTGQYAWLGENESEMATFVVKQVNASGGICGQKVNLINADAQGTVQGGTLATRKVVNVNHVLAVVGPSSLAFNGARSVLEDSGTLMITPSAGTTELNRASKTLFYRTSPSDSLGGRAIARAITKADKYLDEGESFDKVAMLYGTGPDYVSFVKPVTRAMKDYGSPLVQATKFKTGKQSYRSVIANIIRHDPDMIILVGPPQDVATILRQGFQLGYDGAWFVTNEEVSASFIKLATPAVANGLYGIHPAGTAADLRQRVAEQLGHKLKPFQPNTYDAVNVLALAMYAACTADGKVTTNTIKSHMDAVANAGSDDVKVNSYAAGKEAIDNGKSIDYHGMTGPVDFDDYGNVTAPFTVMEVKDGNWESISVVPAIVLE